MGWTSLILEFIEIYDITGVMYDHACTFYTNFVCFSCANIQK